ncbi:hypothetical protein AFFFEF_04160 [Methylorubrum extorquens]
MSVVLIPFLSGATVSADHSIAAESFTTMHACEAAGRAQQRLRRRRVVLWACMTRAPAQQSTHGEKPRIPHLGTIRQQEAVHK